MPDSLIEILSKTASIHNHYCIMIETLSTFDLLYERHQYLEKMMSAFENATNTLESGEDYNSLIAGIINEMEDVQVPDLVTAINRFHSFNQQLLNAVPQQTEE